MLKNKILIIILAAFGCQVSFADCKLNMKGVQFFSKSDSPFQIKLQIKQACSNQVKSRREIFHTKLELYKDSKLIATSNFKKGSWSPNQSKFILKSASSNSGSCLNHLSHLAIDLKKGHLTSLDGLYLNLKSGKSYKYNCPLI